MKFGRKRLVHGTTDHRERFAWYPLRLTDGMFCWLERVVELRAVERFDETLFRSRRLAWACQRRITVSDYVAEKLGGNNATNK